MKRILSLIAVAALLAVSCGENNKPVDIDEAKTFGVGPTDGIVFPAEGQNSVVRFAGKDSNSGGAHPVEEHMRIEIIK